MLFNLRRRGGERENIYIFYNDADNNHCICYGQCYGF